MLATWTLVNPENACFQGVNFYTPQNAHSLCGITEKRESRAPEREFSHSLRRSFCRAAATRWTGFE